MKKLKIFEREHAYYYDFEIENDIRVLTELSQKISEPQILSYAEFEPLDFFILGDDHYICFHCVWWIFEKYMQGDESMTECFLRCAVEDKEWTKQRNIGLTGIYYRKITFLPVIQAEVIEQLKEYIDQLDRLKIVLAEEERREIEETEKQRAEWKVTRIIRKVMPSYGEDSRDGYIDGEYTSKTGEMIRMVERDVFDFGCYAYPKRVEGTDNVFNRDAWTEGEKQLASWLAKFGEFHGIRM